MNLSRFGGIAGRLISRFGVQADIYHPEAALLPDGNMVPDEVVRVGETSFHLEFTQQARDQATSLGVYGSTVAYAIFPDTSQHLLRPRAVLLDEKNRAWLLQSPPATPETGAGTILVKYLVSLIDPEALPDGITLRPHHTC